MPSEHALKHAHEYKKMGCQEAFGLPRACHSPDALVAAEGNAIDGNLGLLGLVRHVLPALHAPHEVERVVFKGGVQGIGYLIGRNFRGATKGKRRAHSSRLQPTEQLTSESHPCSANIHTTCIY